MQIFMNVLLTMEWYLLHEVAMRGYLDCVKVLLSFNASLHPRTPEGDTPKDLAARFSHLNVEIFFGSCSNANKVEQN